LRRIDRILVFPDSQDCPSCIGQSPIRIAITPEIRIQLLFPPIAICFGPSSMNGTPMPKASVDENRHPRSRKEQICGSTTPYDWQPSINAIAQPCRVQHSPQTKLGLRVGALLVPHSLQRSLAG
jgi:hypothetical protein